MEELKTFLLENALGLVLSKIDGQSKNNKKLVTTNFSYIKADGETELLAELLIFLKDNELVSFKHILACFRVQNFEKILHHFEMLLENDAIDSRRIMLVLNSEKYLDSLDDPHYIAIRHRIFEMLSSRGIDDDATLSRVCEYKNQESLLYALELHSETDEIQLDILFKIAKCLESNSLVSLVNSVYEDKRLDMNVIKDIVLNKISVNEQRNRLTVYFNTLLNTVEAEVTAPSSQASALPQQRNAFAFFASEEETKDSLQTEEAAPSLGR